MFAYCLFAYHWWRTCLAYHCSSSGDMSSTHQAPIIGLWKDGLVSVPSNIFTPQYLPDLTLLPGVWLLGPWPWRMSGFHCWGGGSPASPTPPPHISWAGGKIRFRPSVFRTSMFGLWLKLPWIGAEALTFHSTHTDTFSHRESTSSWMLGVVSMFWTQN